MRRCAIRAIAAWPPPGAPSPAPPKNSTAPGALQPPDRTTGGDGELAPVLARSAVAAGCDGVFIETHENPSKALSDGPNQIPLRNLPKLLAQLKTIRDAIL